MSSTTTQQMATVLFFFFFYYFIYRWLTECELIVFAATSRKFQISILKWWWDWRCLATSHVESLCVCEIKCTWVAHVTVLCFWHTHARSNRERVKRFLIWYRKLLFPGLDMVTMIFLYIHWIQYIYIYISMLSQFRYEIKFLVIKETK